MKKKSIGLRTAILVGLWIAILVALTFSLFWRPWQPRVYRDIYVDCSKIKGQIRSLQGVNAGPLPYRGGPNINLSDEYEELGVDWVRIHDFYGPGDIHEMFPDFDADSALASSYNFTATDTIIQGIKAIGAKVIFRLGYSWGSGVTRVKASDYDKWAEVAKHVIMHYNDGWANGFHCNITYWEVWNEPDIKEYWTDTFEQFYRLYETVAKVIRAYNPDLKVGGPAFTVSDMFANGFLNYCKTNEVPLDFFSWHSYAKNPYDSYLKAAAMQDYLHTHGFNLTQNFLTEWSTYSGAVPTGAPQELIGAVYATSTLIYLQDSKVAVANYYRGDAHGWGLFDEHSGSWRKQAYAFKAFRIMLETPNRVNNTGSDTYGYTILAGKSENNNRVAMLISNFHFAPTPPYSGYHLTVNDLPWGNQAFRYERYLLDERHNLALVESVDFSGSTTFTTSETMSYPSFQLIILTAK